MMITPLPSDREKALSSSSDDEQSWTAGGHAEESNNNPEKEESIAKRETRFVRWMRVVVMTVLIASTISVAYAVYAYTVGNEQQQFEQDFKANAHKVLSGMGDSFDLTLTAVDSMVVTMVSFARYTNASWPFVTIPNFESRSAKIRTLSKGTVIFLYLRVSRDQRKEWEAYAKANNAWVNESIHVQAKDPNFHGPIIYNFTTQEHIYDYDAQPMPEQDRYYVQWQNSPMIPRYNPYNWDLLSYYNDRSVIAIEQSHRVVLSEAYQLPDPADAEAMHQYEINVDYFKDYVKPGQNAGEPASDIHYPILDTTNIVTITDPENHPFRGIFCVTIFWSNVLEGILPIGSDGIVVVIENECNPSFTYQINGPSVVYLGRGDLHDPRYDKYEKSSFLWDLDSFSTTRSDYAGIPVNRDACPFFVKVYPSQEMKDHYMTKHPFILTVIAILIFLFTSAVFVLYDQVVEYRQRRVVKSARKTSAIVSSLFPSVVRDRLMEHEHNNSKRKEQQKEVTTNVPKSGTFARFATAGNNIALSRQQSVLMLKDNDAEDENDDVRLHGPPIANLFQHTTIFFADISGFTKWSSNRTPTEVFELLETLYGAFDKIARKHAVFKVETIGDCYVAATGIPNPQEKHAVIMVRFARECMQRMDVLVDTKLAFQLGDDTRELKMRVGLHSGSTTAGVLRGDKGRFQLFGDTVNTASRMESTGVPGKIHISQMTADELMAHGKGDWLMTRDELVMAKGKGEMQTYFVTVTTRALSLAASTYESSCHDASLAASDTGQEEVLALSSSDPEVSLQTIEALLSKRNKQLTPGNISLSSDRENEGKDDLPEVRAVSSESEVSLQTIEALLAKRNKQITSGNKCATS